MSTDPTSPYYDPTATPAEPVHSDYTDALSAPDPAGVDPGSPAGPPPAVHPPVTVPPPQPPQPSQPPPMPPQYVQPPVMVQPPTAPTPYTPPPAPPVEPPTTPLYPPTPPTYANPGYANPGYTTPGDPYAPGPAYGSEPAYTHPAGGTPAYGYPATQGYPAPGYQYVQAPGTNTLAILALVLAFVFWPAGIVCGHIARKQIRRTGEQGNGLALAGIIIGYVLLGLTVLWCGLIGIAISMDASNN